MKSKNSKTLVNRPKNEGNKFTWGRLKFLVSLMTDEQLSSEVTLYDGFYGRLVVVESLDKLTNLSKDSDSEQVTLYGKNRKEL